MAACVPTLNLGFYRWWGSRDSDGYREWHIVHKVFVLAAGLLDGPANALATPGLPAVGSTWAFGGDIDTDCVCKRDAIVTPMVDGEASSFFLVEQIFTNKPADKCLNRVGTGAGTGNPSNDPLLEPPILSGGFTKYTEEKQYDRYGFAITNSAHERLRGPTVEFDSSRVTLRIQINEANLDLELKSQLIDTVNSETLWGFTARKIKLSNISWEQKYTGSCVCYYQVSYEFEASRTGFDREALDEGTKALRGQWNKTTGAWDLIGTPSQSDPRDFIRIHDFNGNLMRVVLDGSGKPAVTASGTSATSAGMVDIEYYPESDFLGEISGLPSDIECIEA